MLNSNKKNRSTESIKLKQDPWKNSPGSGKLLSLASSTCDGFNGLANGRLQSRTAGSGRLQRLGIPDGVAAHAPCHLSSALFWEVGRLDSLELGGLVVIFNKNVKQEQPKVKPKDSTKNNK